MPIIADNPRGRKVPSKSERYLRERYEQRPAASPRPASRSSSPPPSAPPVQRSPTPAAAGSPSPAPSGGKKRKKPKKVLTPAEKRKRYLTWAFWLLVIVALYFGWQWLRDQALILLQMNSHVWATYKAVESEIAARSLLGLFYASFFGALFFITLPVEIIFLYYLGLNYYVVQVLVITLLGNLLGIAFNYFIGWIIGPKSLKWFLKKKYAGFHRKLEKAGGFIVIVGNIIPFPIELFTVFLGAARYGFVRLMIYTAFGKLVKFGLLWLGYKYFVQYVGPYISQVNLPWFLNIIKLGFGG